MLDLTIAITTTAASLSATLTFSTHFACAWYPAKHCTRFISFSPNNPMRRWVSLSLFYWLVFELNKELEELAHVVTLSVQIISSILCSAEGQWFVAVVCLESVHTELGR